ncbi:MAG: FtsX-like permease family protein [Promethearchaeota archaeon]|nr:MAG: FtsX-like permease family protein [Candidatus Lokiarchaeota archaeon]
MSLRERRMFFIFTLIYTVLIFLTSFFIDLIYVQGASGLATFFVVIFFGASLFLSLLYAWIIVSRNRRVWATLKCIGYTSGNINAIVSGMILFTTITGFIIVIEVLFHYTAIMTYLVGSGMTTDVPVVLIGLGPVIITSVLFISVQIFAILLANRKVLKVRPIIALKKVGE